MVAHAEIIEKFANRDINKKTNTVSWNGSRVWCEHNVIYSYGRHWPMAIYLGEKDMKSYFVKNSDHYSVSTSRHQGMVNRECYGPKMPRRKLYDVAKVDLSDLKLEDIVFWREDYCEFVIKDTETGKYYSDYDYATVGPGQEYPPLYMNIDRQEGPFDLVKLNHTIIPLKTEYKPPRCARFKECSRSDTDPRFKIGSFSNREVSVIKVENKFFLVTTTKARDIWPNQVVPLQKEPTSISHALKLAKIVV